MSAFNEAVINLNNLIKSQASESEVDTAQAQVELLLNPRALRRADAIVTEFKQRYDYPK